MIPRRNRPRLCSDAAGRAAPPLGDAGPGQVPPEAGPCSRAGAARGGRAANAGAAAGSKAAGMQRRCSSAGASSKPSSTNTSRKTSVYRDVIDRAGGRAAIRPAGEARRAVVRAELRLRQLRGRGRRRARTAWSPTRPSTSAICRSSRSIPTRSGSTACCCRFSVKQARTIVRRVLDGKHEAAAGDAGRSRAERRAEAAGLQRFLRRRRVARLGPLRPRSRRPERAAIHQRHPRLDRRRLDRLAVERVQHGRRRGHVSGRRGAPTGRSSPGKTAAWSGPSASRSSASARRPPSSPAGWTKARS